MNCKICDKPFSPKSHKHLLCSKDCIKENKRRISVESYYRVRGNNVPFRGRNYNTDYEKLTKKEQRKRYREKNKDKIKERSKEYTLKSVDKRKEYYLKKFFKMSLEDYNNMLSSQNNSCKICGAHESEFTKKLAVDHCHETGKIRGILCHNCNKSLGSFKDSIEILQRAIDYLNKSRELETSPLTNSQIHDTINDQELK